MVTPLHRLIPACAGNTAATRSPSTSRGAHPRVRGEHSDRLVRGRLLPGSSPRARGTRRGDGLGGGGGRLIPACAGNTFAVHSSTPAAPAHPRVRGEHGSVSRSSVTVSGSSPRARGTQVSALRDRVEVGLIPACAGNTRCPRRHDGLPAAHPRVRGEHSGARSLSAVGEGSSPRARGTRRSTAPPPGGYGLIPACAGNTASRGTPSRRPAAHPRVRGEHKVARIIAAGDEGSSPRARGTRPEASARRTRAGLIPACAGNTAPTPGAGVRARAHPRVRGEHRGLGQ